MNKFLSLLFLVSLCANAALTIHYFRAKPVGIPTPPPLVPRPVDSAARPDPATTVPAQTSPALKPVAWQTLGSTNADLGALVDRLRAAGFPPRVVGAVLKAYLRDREYAGLTKLPFWQLISPGTDTQTLIDEANQRINEHTELLLGEPARGVATLSPRERRERYGNLPDAKVEALLKIERDYQTLLNPPRNSVTSTVTEYRARQAQQSEIQKEKDADLKAALTPEEFSEYEMRNSSTADRVIRSVSKISVSEEEDATLYQLQKSFEDQGGARDEIGFSAAERIQRQTMQSAYNDQLRAALPGDRFYKYLEQSDYNYGRLAQFAAKQPSLTPAVTYELYKLQQEAEATLTGQSTPSRDSPQRRAAQQALNARLDALLTPEAAAAYRNDRNGNGGYFFPKP